MITGETTAMTKRLPPKHKKRPPKIITPQSLEKAGLHYLQRFAVSTAQFRRKMIEKLERSCRYHKNQNKETCLQWLETLIQKLTQSGLLNDQAYAGGVLTSMRRQGKSHRAILQKLSMKGIPQDIVEKAIYLYKEQAEQTDDEIEFEAALTLAKKKRIGPFKKERRPSSSTYTDINKHFKKDLGIFARNGFSYDVAKAVLALPKEPHDHE